MELCIRNWGQRPHIYFVLYHSRLTPRPECLRLKGKIFLSKKTRARCTLCSQPPVWLGGPQTSQDVGGVGSPLPRYPVTRLPDLSLARLFVKVGERAGQASVFTISPLATREL